MNRVQQAPHVSKAIHNILWRCQQRLGGWVGSAVVHLGDHNVPNALHFIDKYTQAGTTSWCAVCWRVALHAQTACVRLHMQTGLHAQTRQRALRCSACRCMVAA